MIKYDLSTGINNIAYLTTYVYTVQDIPVRNNKSALNQKWIWQCFEGEEVNDLVCY